MISEFKKDILFSLGIAVLLFVISLFVTKVPQLEQPFEELLVQTQEEIPNLTALEIANSANYLRETDASFDILAGKNAIYIQDYLNMINPTVSDKGLEYYRNPQTRGAVEWFYINLTGNRNVSLAILNAANRENISLNLAFALAHTESHFKIYARNVNSNGSIDRGLFQLNDRTFPQLNEEEFFDPRISARYGMRHLRYCLGVAKDDYKGVAMYNAGVSRIKANQTPATTVSYVNKIKRYRATLDMEFDREVIALFDSRGDDLRENSRLVENM